MKYFIISDVHNHYTEMLRALNEAGFDENNQEHNIILVGDAFDRGDEPVEVFKFLLKMVSKKKIIWIAGNHEYYVLKRLKERKFNTHGHTYNTLYKIAKDYSGKEELSDDEVISLCKKAGLENLISDNTFTYFETEDYVFTHGFIPVHKGEYTDTWRESKLSTWILASGRNGIKEVMVNGLRIPGKTLICGHILASYGNVRKDVDPSQWDDKKFTTLQNKVKNLENFKPYFGDGVIGIDGSVYRTGFINCLVIEEGVISNGK